MLSNLELEFIPEVVVAGVVFEVVGVGGLDGP